MDDVRGWMEDVKDTRLKVRISRATQSVMRMDMTKVLPDLARPVNATSSRRGKHSSSKSEKRNSIGGSTLEEVMRFFSNSNSCGLSPEAEPA